MRRTALAGLLLLALAAPLAAHTGAHPSIHDTLDAVVERMKRELTGEQIGALTPEKVVAFLTEEERHILATEYLRFQVNVPVTVSILRNDRGRGEPFWLEDLGFEKTDLSVEAEGRTFEVWQRDYPAGPVGLGINSFAGGGRHYYVVVGAREPGDKLAVTEIYPAHYFTQVLGPPPRPVRGLVSVEADIPPDFIGRTLLLTLADRRYEAQLVNRLTLTEHPATAEPDQIVLTWSEDPRYTQTIQWRTGPEVREGVARYEPATGGPPKMVDALTTRLTTSDVFNDPVNHRHAVVLRGLEPGTTYRYQVGDGERWSMPAEFTTAPAGPEPFTFVYMGDAQNGLDRWGSLIQSCFARHPEAAFYVMAGDLVNRGNDRDDWDDFFHYADGVFGRRQLIPALGNHEYHGGNDAWLYLGLFELPADGPLGERAYAVHYSNAVFIVLDSNKPAHAQTEWLEEQLATTDATWKFVVYHHPAYASKPGRDNPEIRRLWGALFDRYHVDLALQGHDHAYLRTHPLRGGEAVDSPGEGTIYIVSVSGTKYYDQGDYDFTAKGFTEVSTYQVLDIRIDGNRLTYKAYDNEGGVRDEFVIEK